MSSDSRLSDGIIQLQFWSPLSLATVFVVMVVICGISGLRYNIFLHGPHQSFQTKIATGVYVMYEQEYCLLLNYFCLSVSSAALK